MTPLEQDLERTLLALYERWKQIGYTARRFKRMLTPSDATYRGPVETVKHLLRKRPTEKSGFNRLKQAGKLDWTIEALFETDRPWHSLFTEAEIAKARDRYRSSPA